MSEEKLELQLYLMHKQPSIGGGSEAESVVRMEGGKRDSEIEKKCRGKKKKNERQEKEMERKQKEKERVKRKRSRKRGKKIIKDEMTNVLINIKEIEKKNVYIEK